MTFPSPRLVEKSRAALARAKALAADPRVKRFARPAHYVFLALIVGVLIFRLHGIGWGEVAKALPTAPLFYVFFLLKFLALPCADTLMYGVIWRRPLLAHFPAFVRKRVYNYGVAGYAGEAFIAQWASRTFGFSAKEALIGVKDGNVLSAFTANFTTVALIGGLAASGMLAAAAQATPGGWSIFIVAFAIAATVLTAVFVFRRKILHIGDGPAARVLGVHFIRQAAQIGCTTGMYAAAIPTAAPEAWLLFIALQLVVSRVPFLPNQDLVYLTAALSLSTVINAPDGAVAAMLLTEAGLSQALNFVLFIATAHLARARS
jgi:hypothetical protein